MWTFFFLTFAMLLLESPAYAHPPIQSAEACPGPSEEPRAANGEQFLGVAPFFTAKRMELTFAPMVARFTEAVGSRVHFRTTSSWERFHDRLAEEAYDYAIVDSFTFAQLGGDVYIPLGRAPGSTHVEFIVPPGSPIHGLSGLRGKLVGAWAPEARARA